MGEFQQSLIVGRSLEIAIQNQACHRCAMTAMRLVIIGTPAFVERPGSGQGRRDERMRTGNAGIEDAHRRRAVARRCDSGGKIGKHFGLSKRKRALVEKRFDRSRCPPDLADGARRTLREVEQLGDRRVHEQHYGIREYQSVGVDIEVFVARGCGKTLGSLDRLADP